MPLNFLSKINQIIFFFLFKKFISNINLKIIYTDKFKISKKKTIINMPGPIQKSKIQYKQLTSYISHTTHSTDKTEHRNCYATNLKCT